MMSISERERGAPPWRFSAETRRVFTEQTPAQREAA
jgi:hypothetical protein